MSTPDLFGARLAMWWAGALTRTAPPDAGGDRRAEIRADVHDHMMAGRAQQLPPGVLSRQVAGRVHAIEQVAYIASDVNDNNTGAGTLVADIIGLIGGVLLVAGAAAGLSRRNRPRPEKAADQVRPAAGARGAGSL